MTEAEWLACSDPQQMVAFLEARDMFPGRKARLFAVACCRRIWHLLSDVPGRRAVEVAELFADGHAGGEEIRQAYVAASEVRYRAARGFNFRALDAVLHATEDVFSFSDDTVPAAAAAASAADAVQHAAFVHGGDRRKEWRHQASILRCIFGNPFDSVAVDPGWRTETVTHLATATYADRAFELLPILADALEEAGCTNAANLGHLRGPGPHVRGCWVIDLLLGKQ
jgi:hypothetical protein